MTARKPVDFDTALGRFIKATKDSMTYARQCAELAIKHYQEHGDLSQCQKFLDAMPKNYTRRVAFLQWLAAHAPVTIADGKLLKDRSENALDFNLDGAMAKPFWDFAPEKPIVNFTAADLADAVRKLIARYENADKMRPADDDAAQEIVAIKRAVEPILAKVATSPETGVVAAA